MTSKTRSGERMEEAVKRYQGSASKNVARDEELRKRREAEQPPVPKDTE